MDAGQEVDRDVGNWQSAINLYSRDAIKMKQEKIRVKIYSGTRKPSVLDRPTTT